MGETSREINSAAILLSRQPLRPCALTPWVAKVVEAVSWLKHQNITLVSSLGMQTWEMITAAGSLCGVPLRLVVEAPDASLAEYSKKVAADFDLIEGKYEVVPVSRQLVNHVQNEDVRHRRDLAVIDAADLLIPVSIRPDGFMIDAVAEAQKNGRQVIRDFDAGPPGRSAKLAYDLSGLQLNPELDEFADRYLIHWTRATNDPWPDERPIDFYRAILESARYPRTGFDTLCHILDTGVLRGSPRHMPENTPCVSFTALSPREIIPLMRWRARYTQMSFEPYGIGIPIGLAPELGIRPVRYYQSCESTPDSVPTWITQSAGAKSDWRQEHEYRHRGDLNLARIDPELLVPFCLDRTEANLVRARFGLRVIPLSAD
jgi:hypothetical protein